MEEERKIEAWMENNSSFFAKGHDLLLVQEMREKGLSNEDIIKCLEVIEDICPHCYDAGSGCQCWNDD